MQKRKRVGISAIAFGEMFLIVTMSVAVAVLLSQEVSAGDPLESVYSKVASGPSAPALPMQSMPDVATNLDKVPATSKDAFTWSKWVGDVSKGNTFQTKLAGGATGPSVAGALTQGLFWGAVLGLATKMLLPIFGVDKQTTSAVSTALFVGSVGGGVAKSILIMSTKTGATPGIANFLGTNHFLTANQLFVSSTVIIAVVVFLLMYKKEKKEIVNFQCLPWEPPTGGAKCEECNKDPMRPCSEYRCKSLGQACQLLNPGTGKEQCAWVNKFDVESPKITPWTEPLRPIDAKYVPDTSVRPPAIGVKITSASNGCLPAFTGLQFGIITNEPAQCRIEYNHTTNYSDMQYFFGGDNLYTYNHTQIMRLPGQSTDIDTTPLLRNDGSFALYVRCQDANGNVNVDEYSMAFCVDKGPDTTPPRIEKTSIISGSPVQFNTDSIPIDVSVNEPADCKWSTQSKAYEDMENTMTCAKDVSQLNSDLLYTCSGKLTGIKNKEDNTFYFRCKDQPNAAEKDRNVMVQSYPLVLKGSQSLTIDSVGPNGTISGSTSVVDVALRVQTSNGAAEGKAICGFANQSAKGTEYIPMFASNSYQHEQKLRLGSGTYRYFFRCVDAGGNVAEASTNFSVSVDTNAPQVTRVYRDQALKIVTNEDAECRYSLTSCNFELNDGIKMAYANTEIKNVQYADWNPAATYYVRCTDAYGNEPSPASCSVVARATQIVKESA